MQLTQIIDLIRSSGLTQITWIAVAVFVFYLLYTLYNKHRKMRIIQEGFLLPKLTKKNEYVNSIIVLGLGGSGKTTLIKRLNPSGDIDERISDDAYNIYFHTIHNPNSANEPDSEGVTYSLCFSDYAGQNIGTLVKGFVKQQLQPYSPMRYGYVKSLVLVVDLYPPESVADHEQTMSTPSELDNIRISQNTGYWSEELIDVIFGMLNDNLKYIALFINKSDVFTSMPNHEQVIKESYRELIDKLENYKRGARFTVFVGSAKEGTKVPVLHDDLIEIARIPFDDPPN